ncbi:LytR/AlgR family response regulator transcription factor [Olivibacter sitiensis]|uniref:LytR/AlgR family response regulator transcription factor n=1 Tax=Olivibacter sitiensis TaxID=376470 RepID=UPI000415B693|nr:LytTR family DNA-binding domain-containing protein [Olivibacter sitiensis]
MNAQSLIRCIAIDDEPPALELLVSYISKVPALDLRYYTTNPLDAFGYIQQYQVDLLFIDIQMPHLNGLELLRSLAVKPQIIVTTAFRDYAAECFDLDTLDFLLKPYRFDRFLRAISKYRKFMSLNIDLETSKIEETIPDAPYMYFNVNKEMVKIFLADIIYIESIKDYIRIVTEKKTIITYQRIGYMEQKLPEADFVRAHKSYIVNLNRISSKRGNNISLGKVTIPIGRNYKNKLHELFSRKMEEI